MSRCPEYYQLDEAATKAGLGWDRNGTDRLSDAEDAAHPNNFESFILQEAYKGQIPT